MVDENDPDWLAVNRMFQDGTMAGDQDFMTETMARAGDPWNYSSDPEATMGQGMEHQSSGLPTVNDYLDGFATFQAARRQAAEEDRARNEDLNLTGPSGRSTPIISL